jgi:hypothetical protein
MRLGYRERVPPGPIALERVPTLEKAEMMERFDDLVADPCCAATSCSSGSRRAPATSSSTAATG